MRIQWIQFPLLFISGEFFSQGLNFCLIKVRLIIDSDVVYKNATASLLFFVSMIWLSLFVFLFFSYSLSRSKGEAQAMFLRHEGYLGALGAFMSYEKHGLDDLMVHQLVERFPMGAPYTGGKIHGPPLGDLNEKASAVWF